LFEAVAKNTQGILLMLAALFVFSFLDASAKEVMRSLPPLVAVFMRYFIATMLALLVISYSGGGQLFKSKQPIAQVLRGAMLLGATFCNFTAMHYLQLAQTSAINFMIPLWVCALSGPMLGEKVGWRRWAAVFIGLCGVLIIMRPGSGSFHWAMLFSLASSLCGAMYNILTRKVGSTDHTATSLFYVCLAGASIAAVPLPLQWQMPQGSVWYFIIAMGVAGSLGHYLLIQAHRLAPASVLAPFSYTQVIWMIILGYVLFGDVPDHWTLIGASIVIASGLFVFLRERQLGKQAFINQAET
jgi:drug/metabolite transporter (DMT)-like permease